MLVLSLIVNTASFISTSSDLNDTLDIIYENRGTIPADIGKKLESDRPSSEQAETADSGNSDAEAADSGNSAADADAAAEDENASAGLAAASGTAGDLNSGSAAGAQDSAAGAGSGTAGAAADSETAAAVAGSAAAGAGENPSAADSGAASSASSQDKKTPPSSKPVSRSGRFSPETPYSTRYFVLRIHDGEVESSNLDNIASVTEDDTDTYAAAALRHGAGKGFYENYRFYLVKQGDGKYMAIFLECSEELRSLKLLALWSAIAVAVCIVLVCLLVTLLSRRAIEPTVRAEAQQKQFITDATHELKTPLTVINTSLSVLEMEVGQQKWIEKAKGQTAKMGMLINELVTLSKLDEEPQLEKTSFSISSAAEEIADSFREAAESEGYAFVTDICPGVDYNGDENAIRRLVSILLDNALKYALPDSEISLSLEKKRHAVTLQQTNLCTGMKKENLDRLFDRFYRSDASRSSETGGFGIGLSIAKSIVEAHGGRIQADCPEENRIRFTVTLPA